MPTPSPGFVATCRSQQMPRGWWGARQAPRKRLGAFCGGNDQPGPGCCHQYGCEALPQDRRLSTALQRRSSCTHHKAKKTCWATTSSQMRHRLAAADCLHAIPGRVTPPSLREDREALESIAGLRTAWLNCACSTQCLVGWTANFRRPILFANS